MIAALKKFLGMKAPLRAPRVRDMLVIDGAQPDPKTKKTGCCGGRCGCGCK